MTTRVVHLKRQKGEVVVGCDVYIGRACNRGGWNLKQSIWSNPFSVKKYGRAKSIELYRNHIKTRLQGELELREALYTLRGKTLGCWCAPEACHGDVLCELVEEYWKEKVCKERAHRRNGTMARTQPAAPIVQEEPIQPGVPAPGPLLTEEQWIKSSGSVDDLSSEDLAFFDSPVRVPEGSEQALIHVIE
jgi:Domain of unknown function (DUF4326)